jgi:cytochrome c biogenesis protein CcmG, thiol:disulfide interchange protein DsbE
MNFLISILFLFSASITFSQTSSKDVFNGTKYIGQQFSAFKFESFGKRISSADLKGKIVFINFWFEGCPPCRAEMEGFNKMYDKLKDNKDFIFLSISFDSESEITRFKYENKIEYNIFHIDRSECYRLNFNKGFPTSFILDKTGRIKYCKIGGVTDSKKATKMVMEEIYPKIIDEL